MLKLASGATKAAASSHVNSVGRLGTSIVGLGAGKTSMSCVATTGPLSQLSPGSTVYVIVIVPPQIVKLSDRSPDTVPAIAHAPVCPLLNEASGAT